MRYLMVLALGLISAWMVPTTSLAQQQSTYSEANPPKLPPPPKPLFPCSDTSPCVTITEEDFTTRLVPDLIDRQQGHNIVIGPPLSHAAKVCYGEDNETHEQQCITVDEFQTVLDGVWSAEGYRDKKLPTIFQQMAIAHLFGGGALRAGDVTVLHGSLLGALKPNTFGLAKKWQKLMHDSCILTSDACVGY